MPESRVRKQAAAKKRQRHDEKIAEERAERVKKSAPGTGNRWVPVAFITAGLLGVIWLVVYYLAGQQVPGMRALGDWNVLIGMGLMASSFLIATMWK